MSAKMGARDRVALRAKYSIRTGGSADCVEGRTLGFRNFLSRRTSASLQYNIDRCDPSKGETYKLPKEFGQQLVNNTHEVLGKPPMYKDGEVFLFFFPLLF